ncbi:MAG: hypothetical protein ACLTSX_11385 [Collinsella sp.]
MDPILSEVYSDRVACRPRDARCVCGHPARPVRLRLSLWRKSKRTEADIDALKRALEDRERRAGK